MFAPSAQSGEQGADAGVDQTCLKPPPAATIRMIPATGGSPDSMHLVTSLRSIPAPRPRVNMPTTTAMESANSGVPRVSNTNRTRLALSSMKMSTSALPNIRTTGSRTENNVMPNDGRRPVLAASAKSVCVERVGSVDDDPLPGERPNSGPARMIVGIATTTPRASVMPRSALRGRSRSAGRGAAARARASPKGLPAPGFRR